MDADTLPTSFNYLTGGTNAGTSKLCFSVSPPWETFVSAIDSYHTSSNVYVYIGDAVHELLPN